MPKCIQSALQSRQSDQNCIQDGVPSLVLMEKAAMAIANFIESHEEWSRILFVCGPGNNGADGLAAARLLQEKGKKTCCLVPSGKTSLDFQVQLAAAKSAGVMIEPLDSIQENPIWYVRADVLVDAMFGSGLSRDLGGIYAQAAQKINAAHLPVVAIDIPSGLDGNTGKILGTAVHASYTLSLDTLKEGDIRNDGPAVCGTVIACPIGIADRYHESSLYVLDEEYAASLLPARPIDGHKGNFGKVLLAGGSFAMQGALNMAATAAFHGGCGLLTLFTPESAARAIAAKNDLAMIITAPETNGFFALDACLVLPDLCRDYTVFGLGNGMGKGKGARLVVETLLEQPVPVVIDADGINCLVSRKELLKRKEPTILTPHVKEFSRISGFSTAEILADPIGCARAFLKDNPDVVLVLKAAKTVVASKDKMAWLDHPNSGLAKGGSGDILAGLITGLFAWIPDPFAAACLGVYVHNAASFVHPDLSPICMTPHDIIHGFNTVFTALAKKKS